MNKPRQNNHNVLIRKLLHVSDLSGPTSGSAQLYKTNLHEVRQCMSTEVDMCTITYKCAVTGAACRL